jgi:hypothetical protein
MAVRKASTKKKKSNVKLLLFLLVALGGVGAWNYQRNLAAEKAAPSAYAGVSDADLDVLIAAYESEIAALEARGGPNRARVRQTSNLDQGARELERVQRASRAVREANYEVYERQGALEALQAEKTRRRAIGGGSGVLVILRRAFTF